MESKIKHLELIQGIINRMASNSFFLKGWAVTLVSALMVLSAKDSNDRFILLAFVPIAMFWVLDGYFLRQERMFRALYNAVRAKGSSEIDFSMDTRPYSDTSDTWAGVMWSITLRIFYGCLVLAVVLVFAIVHCIP